MGASLQSRVEQLAKDFAGEATTIEELNGLMRLMLKSGLERMLDTEQLRKGDITDNLAPTGNQCQRKRRSTEKVPGTVSGNDRRAVWVKAGSTLDN